MSNTTSYDKLFENFKQNPIEALIQVEKGFTESFESINRERERNFIIKIGMRINNEEKIGLVQNEINTIRAKIENDLLHNFYNSMNRDIKNIITLFTRNKENENNISFALFGDKYEHGNEALKIILGYVSETDKELSKDELSALLKSLSEKGIDSYALNSLLSRRYKEFEQRILYVLFYFHYEKKYFNWLVGTLKDLKQATGETATLNCKTSIIWKSDNETEFIQLIYALHKAGYLDTEEKKITSLVLQVAKVFNVELGNNWQSNFSKSINERNYSYEPKIFEEMKKSFIVYRDKLIAKNKKTNPS